MPGGAAATARLWASLGLLAALVATGLLAWRTGRTILRPVDDLTRSARAVGDGRFDQLVTTDTRDEIGELVGAFHRMTAQLRDLRQSQAARLLRAQQASQAAIDSFPDPVLVVLDLDPAGPLPPVAADPDRLGQVLDNLLVNAATYTEPGGTITLSGRAGPAGRTWPSGTPGWASRPSTCPIVFDRFFRVPGRSRGQGTGLGLAIATEIVTAHGGEIVCESDPGRGTTFRMTLPVSGPPGGER